MYNNNVKNLSKNEPLPFKKSQKALDNKKGNETKNRQKYPQNSAPVIVKKKYKRTINIITNSFEKLVDKEIDAFQKSEKPLITKKENETKYRRV
jgi:hypothetical protein